MRQGSRLHEKRAMLGNAPRRDRSKHLIGPVFPAGQLALIPMVAGTASRALLAAASCLRLCRCATSSGRAVMKLSDKSSTSSEVMPRTSWGNCRREKKPVSVLAEDVLNRLLSADQQKVQSPGCCSSFVLHLLTHKSTNEVQNLVAFDMSVGFQYHTEAG